ncbi:ATP-dependent RNA helicase dhx36 [Plakobranchus ocellatus]|uniref:Putative ATP-dependent RNA helicase DHX57 n=1 Tax=Plakobranchus ocellatus TaxID=259542 RepID=A0AAV4B8L6_9GAST|nr:ATP-dependent RNA helicase dhx36 [Plakobranchus ocellatus]
MERIERRAKRKGSNRPNRGGGRFNRGGRGRGRNEERGRGRGGGGDRGRGRGGGWSASRKGGLDLDDSVDGPSVNGPGYNDHPASRGGQVGRGRGTGRGSHTNVKVAMQVLYMSSENQEMVRETLQTLRMDEGEEERGCGFSSDHCHEALQLMDGDVGAALEYLLNDLFNISLDVGTGENLTADSEVDAELLEAREEEKMALQSIYEAAFEERIPNKCWVLSLDLAELSDIVQTNPDEEAKNDPRHKAAEEKEKKVCQFYMKGKCKFKDKCRMSHSLPLEEGGRMADLSHPIYNRLKEVEADIKPPFALEIRFPDGCKYPQQPPLIAFSALEDSSLPAHTRLNISQFLMSLARDSAQDSLPCVFSLVSALEDKDKLQELIQLPPPALSKPVALAATPSTAINSHSFVNHKNPSRHMVQDALGRDDTRDKPSNPSGKAKAASDSVKHSTEGSAPPRRKKDATAAARSSNPIEIRRQNTALLDEFKKKQASKQYQNMQVSRQQLPAWDKREEVTKLVACNQVVVISGMTGCGKTTQVPQFLLDEALSGSDSFSRNIICTQPRRISAMAVAQRVADERAEKLGRSVGYQIRLESVMSQYTRLLFCTTGIILRRLESDPLLDGVTHIIIDEVHERSEESDFLLMILRNVLDDRPDLKVILMSATLNADLFSDYFDECPVLEIPGRTYPVQEFFLEDAIDFTGYHLEEKSPYTRPTKNQSGSHWQGSAAAGAGLGLDLTLDDLDEELAAFRAPSEPAGDRVLDMRLNPKQLKLRYPDVRYSTIKTMAQMDLEKLNFDLVVQLLEWIMLGKHEFPRGGAILIFMPGFAEIQTLYDQLLATSEFGIRNKSRYKIIPLHSTLSSEEQNSVFNKPPKGVTKIVIATNIAETSITIDDIVFVIDVGRMKEKRYDQAKSMESLETVWVSKANALQRRGRAGRVQEGVCFHLFTSHHFEFFLREQPIPEIQRACLEQLVLKIKMLPVFEEMDVEEVLADLIEPPSIEAVHGAVKRLTDLGALDEDITLTPLGYHVGSLPVDVRIGKLMLFGAIFRCLDSALTIAACLSFKSPFVTPFGLKQEADEKRKEFAMGNSDYLTMLNAYKGWSEVKEKGSHRAYLYCQENFLSIKTLQMLASLKQQYVELLSDIGFIRSGIRLRDVERAGKHGSDGVAEITGLEANVNSSNWKVMSGMLVAALFPNIVQVLTPDTRYAASSSGAVVRAPNADELKFKTKLDGYVSIHPSSVNFQVRLFSSPYLVYHEKVKTTKVYVRDSSMVSVYPLLLFGGGSMSLDLYQGSFLLSVDDGWISFKASTSQVAELVRDLRAELDQLLSDKISQPDMDLLTCPRGSKIINCIVTLISTQ